MDPKIPKFKKIERPWKKSVSNWEGHPGKPKSYEMRLSEKKRYLVHLNGQWTTGEFVLVWFGWTFYLDGGNLAQLDGNDGSRWRAIYEIQERK